MLQETWLTKNNEHLVNIPGYKYYGTKRPSCMGGGVSVVVSNKLRSRLCNDLVINDNSTESCVIEINEKGTKILVGSIYRPPNSDIKQFMINYKKIVATTQKLKCHCIVGMDHNLDFLKTTRHPTTQDFIDLNLTSGLFPTVTRPTRVTHNSATLIDNIMTSRNLYDTCRIGILILDISDHLSCLLVVPHLKKVKGELEYITK